MINKSGVSLDDPRLAETASIIEQQLEMHENGLIDAETFRK